VVITFQRKKLALQILCHIILELCRLQKQLIGLVFNIDILKTPGVMFVTGAMELPLDLMKIIILEKVSIVLKILRIIQRVIVRQVQY